MQRTSSLDIIELFIYLFIYLLRNDIIELKKYEKENLMQSQ